MISIFFIALAAICNAAMDSVEGWRIQQTVFAKLDQKFWDRSFAGPKFNIGGWKFDGWHCAKSGMIVFFIVGAVVYQPILFFVHSKFFQMIGDVIILGAIYNIVAPNFYGKIFKLKS